ncbi:MAG: hypothetical protein GX162_03835 [Firmicutes bacterium]|nr:hypothetical protein [Bacillota bacterium]
MRCTFQRYQDVPDRRTVAARYQYLVSYNSPWEHVWVQLIEHPDTYPRAIYEISIRDTLQKYMNIIFEGRQDVVSTLEQAHQVISAMDWLEIGRRSGKQTSGPMFFERTPKVAWSLGCSACARRACRAGRLKETFVACQWENNP